MSTQKAERGLGLLASYLRRSNGLVLAATALIGCDNGPLPPIPPPPVASVTVSPSAVTLVPGASWVLSLTLKDAQDKTLTGREVTWSSSSPATASVSTAGR